MPRIPDTDVIRRKLLDLGIKAAKDKVAECVRRLERMNVGDDISEWSIYHPESGTRVSGLHRETFLKIKAAWLIGKLGFLDELDLGPIVAASEADRQEETLGQEYITDTAHPMFKLFEERRQGAGISKTGISPEARYEDFQKAKALAPEQMWTYEHMTSIGMDRADALELLLEYDSIYYDCSLAYVPSYLFKEDGSYVVTQRLLNFRRFSRFLTMHYEMFYNTEYSRTDAVTEIEAPPHVIRVASELRTKGVIESDEHLEIAGDGLMRYSVWESRENLEAFYKSLSNIKRRKAAHQRFVAYLDDQLGIWKEVQNG